MKKSISKLLQTIVVIIGITAAGLLLWEPQIEGVNANATNFEIYFKDPFLALVYIGSIPFFIGVYKVFKFLGYAGQNNAPSPEALKTLQTIKYCALAVIGFVVIEEIIIMFTHGNDDATGGFFMGFLITLGSLLVAFTTNKIQKHLIDNKQIII